MVESVRSGSSMRAVARELGVSERTVRRWCGRCAGGRLDRADFCDRRSGSRVAVNRTDAAVEAAVLAARSVLAGQSDLGFHGAVAVHALLSSQELAVVPSVRTIGRILARTGAVERRYRLRRPAPPCGWYLPLVATGSHELDSFDFVTDLALRAGTHFEVFNAVSLHGGLADSYFAPGGFKAPQVVEACLLHWQRHGLPSYAQFDNDARFIGPHSHEGVTSRVVRMCLALGVTPVFAPPREMGFQAAIESYNGLWQAKVWNRFEFKSFQDVADQSRRFVEARHRQLIDRIEAAPSRPPITPGLQPDLQAQPRGKIVFIRRTDDKGQVSILEKTAIASPDWIHRLVRAELDLDEQTIQTFALSRRQPAHQPLLSKQPFQVRTGRFHV